MKGVVNLQQRKAKMRAHTATHLLHAALGDVLNNVKQAGSLVDEDYLRFDFTADDLLTHEQLQELSKRVNTRIQQAHSVMSEVKSYDEAVATGAKAFFEDKYGDEVRVVSIKNSEDTHFSVELCGWTHVNNTANIGSFIIVEHGSVASWVKRVAAYTGPKVAEYALHLDNRLYTIAQELKVKPWHIEQKIEKTIKEQQNMSDTIQRLQEQQVTSVLQSITSGNNSFDVVVHTDKYEALASLPFKVVSQKAKDFFTEQKVCIYNTVGNFALLGPGSREFASKGDLKWGGSDTFVQGRDPKIGEII